MKSKTSRNRLLLVQVKRINLAAYYYIYRDLRKFREMLIKEFPKMKNWFPEKTFDLDPIWKDKPLGYPLKDKTNTAGAFMAANLNTPTTVMRGEATPIRILTELKQAKEINHPYTHVGFSVLVDAYSKFVEFAKAVKEFDDKVITIAGNVGAMFEGTDKYVDYVCIGDGVRFMRKLLGENVNKPYQLKVIPSKQYTEVLGINIKQNIAQLVTKLGCPLSCDFCITAQMFKDNSISTFATPQQVHDQVVEYRNKIKKEFTILFCEPTAIIAKKWWYELFDLFKEESYDYPVYIGTTVTSLQGFDFDRISDSSLRFESIGIGIESFSKNYSKNQGHKVTKKLIKQLADYGIIPLATFIIGFDHHNHKNVWEEIYRLVDLDATTNVITNLRPLPSTPIWSQLKKEGRLLDIPYDFYYMAFFQAFKHPHFKPGFEDILPLMYKIYEYLEKEFGYDFLNIIKIFEKIPKLNEKIIRNTKFLKKLSENLFPSWKKHLNPSQEQINKYQFKLGSVLKRIQ